MKGFIDIHTHILFGVDDGAKDLSESIAMIEKGVEEGISTFFLTPHFYNFETFEKGRVVDHFSILKSRVEDLDVALYLGSETHFSYDLLEMVNLERFRLSDDTVLLEFPFRTIPTHYSTPIKTMIESGLKIVIAHPERIEDFRNNIKHLERLKSLGCRFQVTAGSVVGKFGFFIKRFSHKLIRKGLCDFIASDVHNLRSRDFYMDEAFQLIRKKYGEERALDLFINNQKKYIVGD